MKAIKNKLLSAVATASGLAVAGSASASVYDSHQLTGGDPNETHFVGWVQDGVCETGCDNFSSQGLEGELLLSIPNASPATGAEGTPVFPVVNDHYVCDSPNNADTSCATPPTLPYYSTYFPQSGGTLTESPLIGTVTRWDIQTDSEGRISDGWFVTTTPYGPFVFATYTNVTTGTWCGFSGGAGGNIDVNSIETNALTATAGEECVGHVGLIDAGFVLDAGSAQGVMYATCDTKSECGQFGKSVPVPAFAAGVLGLGLVGVTLLTGRRKKIQ